jgi:uncharacterized protein YjbI with pentapeptide repeats
MANPSELKERWEQEPGRTIREKIYAFLPALWEVGHGHKSEELFDLLDKLPFRDEVRSGRDLRGLGIVGLRELDLSECDFSYGGGECCYCDLTSTVFDRVQLQSGTLSNILEGASFRKAFLRRISFNGSFAQRCNFDDAKVKLCDLRKMDLRGSSFRKARIRDGSFSFADLRDCDFRGALLDKVVFENVRIDRTTDFRGAKLINLSDTDYVDVHGKPFHGTDWKQANYDETTQYMKDPTPHALKDLGALLTVVREDKDDARARKLDEVLRKAQRDLKKKYDADWAKKLEDGLTPAEKAYLAELWERAGDIVD